VVDTIPTLAWSARSDGSADFLLVSVSLSSAVQAYGCGLLLAHPTAVSRYVSFSPLLPIALIDVGTAREQHNLQVFRIPA
jgi:hypothetical protein